MTEPPLAGRAEAAIRRLRDVDGVSVLADGNELVEIHVVSRSERPAKHIVRDVQAVLRTDLGLSIDHRVVSVALAREPAPGGTQERERPVDVEDAREPSRPTARHPASQRIAAEHTDVADDRIRYENVNLIVHGQRTQAQVELRWKGLPRIGNASGLSARDDAQRLVAQATALAVQEFLADPVALQVRDVAFVDVTGRPSTSCATCRRCCAQTSGW